MGQQRFDKSSVESITNHAKLLTGKTLDEVVTLPVNAENSRNRGNLGNLVEQHFFDLPPTSSGIDFPKAGLELKTTGLLQKTDGTYKAKERLVLTMLNYLNMVDEEWETSVFYKKSRLMLILFYLYEGNLPSFKQRFVLDPLLYKIEEHDLEIIKKDWETIQQKVLDGKAHEISEGDTFYLGACRKGAGGPGEALRDQPRSEIKAKSRAFSFKPSYVNALLQGHQNRSYVLGIRSGMSFETATKQKLESFLGLPLDEISNRIGYLRSGPNHKGFIKDLTLRILSGGGNKVPELEKAGIEIKTIRLKRNGTPREHMSFPGFKFTEIVEQNWEDSSFFEKLESKFLFVVVREDESGVERLDQIKYWNMPYVDRLEAMKVWEITKDRVKNFDASDLPKPRESHVAHVRPKGRNGEDTIPTPQGTMRLRQCFWLNSSYIKEVLSENSSSGY